MLKRILFYGALILLMAVVLFPLYWIIATSLKTGRDAFAIPPVRIFEPTLDNYRKILSNQTFLGAFANSFVTSIVSSAISVAVGSVAAYGLVSQESAYLRSQEKFILSLRIAPPLLFVIPVYFLAAKVGALNQHWLLIAVYAFVNTPFAISLLITFFTDIPRELRDAARVDGARELTVFRQIFLPAARGGIIATMILCVLFTWNEFFVALMLTGRNTQTLPVSITSFLTFQGIQWGALTAAGSLIMLPMIVLGLLVQGQIVRGLTLGSVKG